MDQKKVFLLIVDISGYTKFMRLHKMSMIHAEGIITQLLDSIIGASKLPLVAHELEGDAVSFYAQSDGSSHMAQDISDQILRLFSTFKTKEAELLSDCSLCVCEACASVDKLRLKAVAHHGDAVFSKVGQFQKVAGVDVIKAHRLLKNSVAEDEYILATSDFNKLANNIGTLDPHPRKEKYDDIGSVDVVVYYPETTTAESKPVSRSIFQKIGMSMKLDFYLLKRLFSESAKTYHNLPKAA